MDYIVDNAFSNLSAMNPAIERCFFTKKGYLPDSYSKRTSFCYELEYITWGEGYVITDGQRINANAGTVFFRKPGMEIHGILPYASCGILLNSVPTESMPIVSNFSNTHPIGSLFLDTYKYYLSNDSLDILRMKANIYHICYYLMNNEKKQAYLSENVSASYYRERLEVLKEYINENIDKHMTLGELADICNISAGFLCRLFKQANDMTLFSYINECRMQKAKELLIETNRPIKDICVTCGFDTESYFYRTFKKAVHISPAEYRKVHRQPFME